MPCCRPYPPTQLTTLVLPPDHAARISPSYCPPGSSPPIYSPRYPSSRTRLRRYPSARPLGCPSPPPRPHRHLSTHSDLPPHACGEYTDMPACDGYPRATGIDEVLCPSLFADMLMEDFWASGYRYRRALPVPPSPIAIPNCLLFPTHASISRFPTENSTHLSLST